MHTDDGFLLHCEQRRRFGPVSLFSIVFSLCMPLTVFVSIPFSLASLAGPSSLLGVIIAAVVLLLVVLHASELSACVPRAWCTIHIALSSHGSLPSALLGTIEMIDSLALVALLAKATAAHTNVLFRDLFSRFLTVSVSPSSPLSSWLFDDQLDLTSMIGLLMAFILASGSLKVVATVSFCLLVVSCLVVVSCSLVAFFHADPINWIEAPFFSNGLNGVLKSACTLLAGLRVPSLVVSLLDDTWQPRSRAPCLLPSLSLLSSIFCFLVALTFSLCINVSRVPEVLLLPNVFHTLNIPAARYMLTVASVCGLWSALLSSLLPGSRLILALSSANLFPLTFINGSPQRSLCVFFCIQLACLPFKTEHLLGLLSFTTPLSLLLTVCLTVGQHYGTRSIGLEKETSRYKRVKERDPLDRPQREVSHQSISSFASSRRADSEGDSDYESLPLRNPRVFSAASYNAVAASSRIQSGERHNCLAHQCDRTHPDSGLHLYSNEVPELPYYGAFTGGVPHSVSDTVDTGDAESGRRAAFLFSIHIALSSIVALLAYGSLPLPNFISAVLILAAVVLIIFVGRALNRLPQSAASLRWQNRVPLFPWSSLLSSLCLVLLLSSTDSSTLVLASVPLLVGALIHVLYAVLSRGAAGYSSPSGGVAPLVIVNLQAFEKEDEERVARVSDDENTSTA